jgi:hypothetical protein
METKTCTKCGVERLHAEFSKRSDTASGLASHCKVCRRTSGKEWHRRNADRINTRHSAHYEANKDRIIADQLRRRRDNPEHHKAQTKASYQRRKDNLKPKRAAWRAANLDRHAAMNKAWYEANKDRHYEVQKLWVSANPEKCTAKSAKRRAAKVQATPKWANSEKIEKFYAAANFLGMVTGEWHHVDHIVPLQSKLVCGLHCEANLRVLRGSENLSKSNRHWPDMP